ncbi:MAG: Maf family protein [Gammaproteobacteria bacterium]
MPEASPELVLASRSPRRAEFLRLLGVAFEVVAADVDEGALAGEAPRDYVCRVARLKATTAAARLPGRPVLAADTTVAIDGELLGKPADAAAAAAMLRRLSGRSHEVFSAVVLKGAGAEHVAVAGATVEFGTLDAGIIDAYVASGEPLDKAGAYGIQGLGGALVTRISGSYSAVVGLPLAETRGLLDRAGLRHRLSG